MCMPWSAVHMSIIDNQHNMITSGLRGQSTGSRWGRSDLPWHFICPQFRDASLSVRKQAFRSSRWIRLQFRRDRRMDIATATLACPNSDCRPAGAGKQLYRKASVALWRVQTSNSSYGAGAPCYHRPLIFTLRKQPDITERRADRQIHSHIPIQTDKLLNQQLALC
jgi:hypothetical protein